MCFSARARIGAALQFAVAVVAVLVTAAAVAAAGGWLFTKHGDTVNGQTSVLFHEASYTVYAEVSGGRDLSLVLLKGKLSLAGVEHRSRSQAVVMFSPRRACRPNPRCGIHRPRPDRRSPETPTYEGAARSSSATPDPTSGASSFATAKVTPFRPRRRGTTAVPRRLPRLGDRTPFLDRRHDLGIRQARKADDARAVLPDQKHLPALSPRQPAETAI